MHGLTSVCYERNFAAQITLLLPKKLPAFLPQNYLVFPPAFSGDLHPKFNGKIARKSTPYFTPGKQSDLTQKQRVKQR